MREFRKKYTKNFHKIRKQKIMKSRKRGGGGYPSLSLPNFFKKKEEPPLKEYAPQELKEYTPQELKEYTPQELKEYTPEVSLSQGNEEDDDNHDELDYAIRDAEESMKRDIEPIERQADIESIERQADKLFTPETPEIWNKEMLDFDKYPTSVNGLNSQYIKHTRNLNYRTHGFDAYKGVREEVESLVSFLKHEKRNLKEKKKIYLKALNEYEEKRKEILVLLKKQPNSVRAFFTSSNKLESIIERANANNEISPEKVDELVNKKVEVKKAKNIKDRSKHIVNSVTKIYDVTRKKYYELKKEYDQEILAMALFGSDEGGGSKKRHTKRHTKRHKRNNKKRYTKKRR
jgi:hypothetical protein